MGTYKFLSFVGASCLAATVLIKVVLPEVELRQACHKAATKPSYMDRKVLGKSVGEFNQAVYDGCLFSYRRKL